MSIKELSTEFFDQLDLTNSYSESTFSLGVVAGMHGKEDKALRVAKALSGLAGVTTRVANYPAVIGRKRWLKSNMSWNCLTDEAGWYPRKAPYELLRPSMLVNSPALQKSDVVFDLHSSDYDQEDLIWAYKDAKSGELVTSGLALHLACLLRSTEMSSQVILMTRPINLLRMPNCVMYDLGISSHLNDPEEAYKTFRWLTEITPSDLVCRPSISWYEYVGSRTGEERKKVGLPGRMETYEPIDPDKAVALGLPSNSCALSWNDGPYVEFLTPIEAPLETASYLRDI